MTKTILNNINFFGSIIIPDFEVYYSSVVVKTGCVGTEEDTLISGMGLKIQIKVHSPIVPRS